MLNRSRSTLRRRARADQVKCEKANREESDQLHAGLERDRSDDALVVLVGIDVAGAEENGKNAHAHRCQKGDVGQEREGKRINHKRVEQALEKTPDEIATACPFCLIMLRDGVTDLDRTDVAVRDVAEWLADATGAWQTAEPLIPQESAESA